MRWFFRLLAIIFVVVLVLLALTFINTNSQPHMLAFLDWQVVQAPVGVWMLVTLILGVVLGWLAGVPQLMVLRRQNKRLQKRLSAVPVTSEAVAE